MVYLFYLTMSVPLKILLEVWPVKDLAYETLYGIWKFMEDIYAIFCFVLATPEECRAGDIYPYLTDRKRRVTDVVTHMQSQIHQ